MSAWSIDLNGVGQVIADTGAEADAMTVAITAMGTALGQAADHSGSAVVGAALGGWATARTSVLQTALQLPGSMIRTAVQTIALYQAADQGMAQQPWLINGALDAGPADFVYRSPAGMKFR